MAQGQDEDAIKKDGILEVLKAADAEIKQSQLLTPDRSQPDDDQAESNLKPPAKRVAPKSAKTKKAKKQKLSGDDFILSTNPQSLWDSNPLAREADDPDVQKPNFTEATCRAKAMKELRHSNADPKEVETIDEACKVFGHLQMSVAGNNKFLHRRMKTVGQRCANTFQPLLTKQCRHCSPISYLVRQRCAFVKKRTYSRKVD